MRGTKSAASDGVHPEQLAPFLPVFFILIVVVVIKGILGGRGAGKLSYERRDPLFSPAERSFLGVLEQIVGKDYRIIGKVRIADIIRPRKGLSGSARTSALNPSLRSMWILPFVIPGLCKWSA